MNHAESLTSDFLAYVDMLTRLYPAMLAKTGLTRLRWGILKISLEQAPLTMSELTAQLELPKSNITYHVDWLERQGYIKREPSADDRRVTNLLVTPAGAERVQMVPRDLLRRITRLTENVPAEELEAMERGIRLLVERSELLFGD